MRVSVSLLFNACSCRDAADLSPDGLRYPGVNNRFLSFADQFAETNRFYAPELRLSRKNSKKVSSVQILTGKSDGAGTVSGLIPAEKDDPPCPSMPFCKRKIFFDLRQTV